MKNHFRQNGRIKTIGHRRRYRSLDINIFQPETACKKMIADTRHLLTENHSHKSLDFAERKIFKFQIPPHIKFFQRTIIKQIISHLQRFIPIDKYRLFQRNTTPECVHSYRVHITPYRHHPQRLTSIKSQFTYIPNFIRYNNRRQIITTPECSFSDRQ